MLATEPSYPTERNDKEDDRLIQFNNVNESPNLAFLYADKQTPDWADALTESHEPKFTKLTAEIMSPLRKALRIDNELDIERQSKMEKLCLW